MQHVKSISYLIVRQTFKGLFHHQQIVLYSKYLAHYLNDSSDQGIPILFNLQNFE
jgi:hypothetical protein